MNNFLGDLKLRYMDDGKRWEVLEGFTYRIGDPNSRTLVRIPKGFITDFASFPLGILFKSPGGKWDKPAVVHDLLYRQGFVEHDHLQWRITRKDADDIFKEAMEVAGVNWLARQIIYAGVRVGGRSTWNKYRWVDTDGMEGQAAEVGRGKGVHMGSEDSDGEVRRRQTRAS